MEHHQTRRLPPQTPPGESPGATSGPSTARVTVTCLGPFKSFPAARFSFFLLGVTVPEGPEPALGFSKKPGVPRRLVEMSSSKQNKKNRPIERLGARGPGSRERFNCAFVCVTFNTVTVAGVPFSFSLSYRSGREAHRGLRFLDPGRHFYSAVLVRHWELQWEVTARVLQRFTVTPATVT